MSKLSKINMWKLLPALAAAFVMLSMPVIGHAADDILEGTTLETLESDYYEDAQDGVKKGKASKEVDGLPQLNFNTYTPQIFWMLILFAVMYFLMSRKAIPDLSSTIENRKNQIDSDLETAEKLQAEAESVQTAYEDNLQGAHDAAASEIQAIDEKMKKKANKQLEAFQKKAEADIDALEARIEDSKQAAMESMSDIASEVSADAVEKIIGVKTDASSVKSVVSNLTSKTKAKAA